LEDVTPSIEEFQKQLNEKFKKILETYGINLENEKGAFRSETKYAIFVCLCKIAKTFRKLNK
jgi:hypothetical protein